jgi:hypothetical protein
MKVPSPVGDPLVQPPDLASQLPVAAAGPLAASALPLQKRELLLGFPEPPWVRDHLASRERGEVDEAHINADPRPVSPLDLHIRQLDLQDHVPVADAIPLEHGHLDRASVGDRTMLEQADQPRVLDVESAISELDPVPVDVADRLEPVSTLEARVAGLLTRPDAAEEGFERLVEPPERLLKRGVVAPCDISVEGAQLLELVGLIGVANAHAAAFPGIPSLLQRGVVHLAVGLQDAFECLTLLGVGIQPVLVAEHHLSPLLRLDVAANRLGRHVSGSADMVGARPEARISVSQLRELPSQHIGGVAFEPVQDLGYCQGWRQAGEEMHVIRLYLQGNNLSPQRFNLGVNQLTQSLGNRAEEHPATVLGAPDQVVGHRVYCVPSSHDSILAQTFYLVKYNLLSRKEERHSPPR